MVEGDRLRISVARWRWSMLAGACLAGLSLLVGVLGGGAMPAAASDGSVGSSAADPCQDLPRAFFDDVGDASAAASSVDCLVWHDIIEGVTYERFGTGDPLRRDQLASLLDRMIATAGVTLAEPDAAPFGDVRGVHAAAIGRLAEAGIVEGRGPERFDPEDPVRRDQLASMVVRTYDALAETDAADRQVEPHAFTDLDGNVHSDAIGRAVDLDLVEGVTPTTFEARRASSRGQTAMVVARLLQRLSADGLIVSTLLDPSGYDARIGPLPDHLEAQVRRWTWRSGCPVPPSELALAEVVFVDFDGIDRWGLLVVNAGEADDIVQVFGELYADDFPIARIEPIERFRGDDDASMAANNTSAFNCRAITGSTRFSQHSYGWAIDINPIQNPYVRGSTVLPPAGRDYLDRRDVRPGMLLRPGAVDAFDRVGWTWGGDWNTLKDYQHFER
jgi:hypothetical protein